jgi:hypothetical protein
MRNDGEVHYESGGRAASRLAIGYPLAAPTGTSFFLLRLVAELHCARVEDDGRADAVVVVVDAEEPECFPGAGAAIERGGDAGDRIDHALGVSQRLLAELLDVVVERCLVGNTGAAERGRGAVPRNAAMSPSS